MGGRAKRPACADEAASAERIAEDEPLLYSRIVSEEEQAVHREKALDRSLDSAEETILSVRLQKSEGGEAFGIIQRLGRGRSEETVMHLIKRFGTESEKNKAEIALSLVKIAKRTRESKPQVRAFLMSRAAKEESLGLQTALKETIRYLEED